MPEGGDGTFAEFDEFSFGAAPRVIRQLVLFTVDLAEAEDVTHEAFSRAWLRWSTLRSYDAAARLRFITRARLMGLSCEQVTALLPVWAGTNCGAARDRVGHLVDEKQAEIAERIAELEQFSAQVDAVRASLDAEAPSATYRSDLTCCVPESPGRPVAVDLTPRR